MRAARLSDLRAPRTARVPTHQQCAMQKRDSPMNAGALRAQSTSTPALALMSLTHLSVQDLRGGSCCAFLSRLGQALDRGDGIVGHILGAGRGLLNVAENLLSRGPLLLDRRCDGGGDFADLADGIGDALIVSTVPSVAVCMPLI